MVAHGVLFVKSGTSIKDLPQIINKGCTRCGGMLSLNLDIPLSSSDYTCLSCSWICYIEIKQDAIAEDILTIAEKVRNGTLSYGLGKILYDLSMQNGSLHSSHLQIVR